MTRKIVITGGAGYIGYHVVKQLLSNNDSNEIYVIDKFIYDEKSLDKLKKDSHLKIIKGDICNIFDMTKVIKNSDIVIALAAIVGDPASALNEEQTIITNYHSTNLLIQLCNYYKIKRLIFTSSCSVYGEGDLLLNEGSRLNPLSLYAKTRVMSEQLIMRGLDKNIDWTILRLATVFGWSERMRFDLVVNFFTAKAFYTKKIQVFGADQWRPLIHVKDVARAIVLSTDLRNKFISKEILNVGDNNMNFKIESLASTVKKLIPGTKIISKKINHKDKRNYRVSFDKIQHLMNFNARFNLSVGIKEIINKLANKKINYLDDKYYNVKYLYKYFRNK